MGKFLKNWKVLFLALIPLLVLSWSQGCTNTSFFSIKTNSDSFAQLSGNGGTYEGKLVIVHHNVPDFKCEGMARPESILIRQPDLQWQLIQNAPEKCAIVDHRPVENVVYDESVGKASYNGKTFEAPKILVVDTLLNPSQPDLATDDGVCADISGNCSLAAALMQSATLAHSTEVTVKILPGTYLLSGLPQIVLVPGARALTIDGGSAASTILDGQGLSAIFQIQAAGSRVTLSKLTIQNANGIAGGGISSTGVDLVVDSCLLQNNLGSSGGAISAVLGNLSIQNSRLIANSVRGDTGMGNAIFSTRNELVKIENSEIAHSRVRSTYGVVYSKSDDHVFISGLGAVRNDSLGPAIRLRDTQKKIEVLNSTMALNYGYGLRVDCGVSCLSAGVVIQSSTFYENKIGTTIPARNITMTGSGAPIPLEFSNNILGIQGGGGNCSPFMSSTSGLQDTFLISGGHNLMNENSCDFGGPGNILTTDLQLTPLADNGGVGQSMLPLPGSPAIDAGDNLTCSSVDQRNLPRPVDKLGGGAICDIGAVEVQ